MLKKNNSGGTCGVGNALVAAMAGLSYAMYTMSASNNNIVTGGHNCININYT